MDKRERVELLKERRRCLAKLKRIERSLESHRTHLATRQADPSYRIGKYVSDLGAPAVGPCAVIEFKQLRLQLREAVLALYPGGWPEGAIVCHRCDNGLCIAGAHLFPGTHQDNMRDCALKGRWSRKVVMRKEEAARLKARILALDILLTGVKT